jgi:hypothetical protein
MTEKQFEPLKKLEFWRIEKILRETGQSFKVFSSGGGVRVGIIYDPTKENKKDSCYAEGANFDELIGNLNKVILGELNNDTVLYFTGGHANSKIDSMIRYSGSVIVSYNPKTNSFLFSQKKFDFGETPHKAIEFCQKTGEKVVFHDKNNPGWHWVIRSEGDWVCSQYLNDTVKETRTKEYKLQVEASNLQTLFEFAEVADSINETKG